MMRMREPAFRPGDLVRLISEPRTSRLGRLVGQPSIVTQVDETHQPPRVIVAVYDPTRHDVQRVRCRAEDLEHIRTPRA